MGSETICDHSRVRVLAALALTGLGAFSLFLAGFYSPYTDDASTVSEPASIVWLASACVTIGLGCLGAGLRTQTGTAALGLAVGLTAATVVALLIETPSKDYLTADLSEGDFTSQTFKVAGEAVPVAAAGELSVGFENDGKDHAVDWSIGCNSMSAEVEIKGGTLLTSGVGGTLIGCPRRVAAQERLLDQFFREDPSWRLDGQVLSLSGGEVSIQLGDYSLRTRSSRRL